MALTCLDGDLKTASLGAESCGCLSQTSWHSFLPGTTGISPTGRHPSPTPERGLPARVGWGGGRHSGRQAATSPGISLEKGSSPSQGQHVSRRRWRPCIWPMRCRPSTGRCQPRRVSRYGAVAMVGQLWEACEFPSLGLSSACTTASCAGDHVGPSIACAEYLGSLPLGQ